MRQMGSKEIERVSAAFSKEGGLLGIGIGGIIGGVAALPICFSILNREGVSTSHYLAGWGVVGVTGFLGAMIGTIVGGESDLLYTSNHAASQDSVHELSKT